MNAGTQRLATKMLSRRELFSVRANEPVTIACDSGELWLTEDGHPEDVILVAGARHTTRGTGAVLIEALAASWVHVDAAIEVDASAIASAGAGAGTGAGAGVGIAVAAAPCWSLAAMFDKARLGLGFARVDTGGLITSAMTGRGAAWRALRNSGCA